MTDIMNAVVSIGTGNVFQICGTIDNTMKRIDTGGKTYYEVICANSMDGQFVKLVKPGSDYISTNEIQVFGIYKT